MDRLDDKKEGNLLTGNPARPNLYVIEHVIDYKGIKMSLERAALGNIRQRVVAASPLESGIAKAFSYDAKPEGIRSNRKIAWRR